MIDGNNKKTGKYHLNALIAYVSRTGNTKLIAEKIAAALKNMCTADLCKADDALRKNIQAYDILFIGSWIHHNTMIKHAQKILSQAVGKKIILFASAGAFPESVAGEKIKKNLSSLVNESCQLLDIVLLNGAVDKKASVMINLIPSSLVSQEKKQAMIDVMKNSRQPTDDEYNEAIKKCVLAVSNLLPSSKPQ